MSHALELRNVSKRFGSNQILEHVSFAVEHGKIEAIVGPSGQGKTTLLRMIAGFDQPTDGEIFMDAKCVSSKDTDQP